MKPIHIAIASTTSLPGAVTENLRQIRDFAERAGRDGADVLLTPEMSASGYGPYPEILATAEQAGNGPIFRALAEMARVNGVVVCAGFVETGDGKRYLAHYIVYPDGQYLVQRKNRVTPAERPLDPAGELLPADHPWDIGQPRTPQLHTFHIRDVHCALAICADSGIPNLNEWLAERGVELLLVPTGAGGERKDRVTTADLRTDAGREQYIRVLETVFLSSGGVRDCLCYRRGLAAVNMCGYDGHRFYHVGHGMIMNPMGEVLGLIHGLPNLDRQRPMYTHAEIDVAEVV